MPCTTNYSGSRNAVKANPWERTKIECDMMMNDEEGNLLGHIRSNEDYSITATLLDRDGMTELMTKTFFYIEKSSDVTTCQKQGWEGLRPVDGKTADEVVIGVAEDWLTDQYRTYVHSHGSPQEVFELGQNFIV
jgi:hypothetical protein